MGKKPIYRGGYGIMLTPFGADGKVNYGEMEKQLDSVCRSPIRGVVVLGSTGEFTYFTPSETREIMTFCRSIVNGRKEFICGATAANCYATKELLRFIEDLGADGALVAPPYYFPLGDDDVLDFYTEIAGMPGDLPIIAYHIPQCTSGISLRTYRGLLALPRIAGIKNSGGNILEIMHEIAIRDDLRKDFAVLTGSDESILAVMKCGANGSFTAIGYLYPELVSGIYENLKNKNSLILQGILVRLASLAGSIPYPLGYRLLGEASGKMDFGPYLQAVSKERMLEYRSIQDQMHTILEENGLV